MNSYPFEDHHETLSASRDLASFEERVNWIHATATFTSWKNAITKTKVGNMPLQFSHTSTYAIFNNTEPYTFCLNEYRAIYYLYLFVNTFIRQRPEARATWLEAGIADGGACTCPWSR